MSRAGERARGVRIGGGAVSHRRIIRAWIVAGMTEGPRDRAEALCDMPGLAGAQGAGVESPPRPPGNSRSSYGSVKSSALTLLLTVCASITDALSPSVLT